MYSAHIFDIGGMMLLGMALLKLGVLQGQRSTRFYFRLMVVGFSIGILMRAPGVYFQIQNDFLPDDPVYSDSTNLGLSRLPITLGYIGLFLLIYKLNIFTRLLKSLAAVGKLALTNYVMQTVISVLLFYGVGFGLIGNFERYQLVLICLLVWLAQTFYSLQWLKYYRMGPLEWLWRSAIYTRWQQNKIQNNTGTDTQPVN